MGRQNVGRPAGGSTSPESFDCRRRRGSSPHFRHRPGGFHETCDSALRVARFSYCDLRLPVEERQGNPPDEPGAAFT